MTAAAHDLDEAAEPLRMRVAAEVRAWLGRRRMSGAQLAREMGKSQTFVARRLDGRQAFDIDDLEQVARILRIRVVDLVSRDDPFRPAVPQTYEAERTIRRNRRISRHHLTPLPARDHETTTASAVTSADVTHPQAA